MSNNAETQVNQNITVTGYPGDKPVATMWESKGKITYLKGEAMQYDLSTTGGNSGSPVFNEKNEVIGIHWVAFQINLTVQYLLMKMYATS